MVCILTIIGPNLASIHYQLLSIPFVTTLNEVYSRLLYVSSIATMMEPLLIESSILILNVQHNQGGN